MFCISQPSLHLIWRYKTECTSNVLLFPISIASHLEWHTHQVYIICIIPSFSLIKIQLDLGGHPYKNVAKQRTFFVLSIAPLPPSPGEIGCCGEGWAW